VQTPPSILAVAVAVVVVHIMTAATAARES